MNYRIYIAEFFATFQLITIGTGSIVYANETQLIGDFGIGVCFGLSVYFGVMILSITTGAHMNSAVTFFGLLIKEVTFKRTIALITVQCIAAISASLVVKQFASPTSTLGITQPYIGTTNTWVLEFFLTFFLLITLLLVYKKSHLIIGLAAGTVVFLETWLAISLTGASINPARSLGPALVSGEFNGLWIYLTAPFSAGFLAYLIAKKFRKVN